MTTIRKIVKGLDKYNLFIHGLAERKRLEFTFEELGKRFVMVDCILRDRLTTCVAYGSLLQKLHEWPLVAFCCSVNLVDETGVAEIEENCLICGRVTQDSEFCSDGTCGCSFVRGGNRGELFGIVPNKLQEKLSV